MTARLTIPAHERGSIRVFAINKPAAEISDALKTLPKADLARQLLDNPHLDTASAEIFPVSDLTGVGLATYLSEGYAVEDTQIDADRNKLDALDAYVLLLFSDGSAGADVILTPTVDLTLIGTYIEYQPPAGTGAIAADSAKPYTGTTQNKVISPRRGRAGSVVVVLGALLILGLALWGLSR